MYTHARWRVYMLSLTFLCFRLGNLSYLVGKAESTLSQWWEENKAKTAATKISNPLCISRWQSITRVEEPFQHWKVPLGVFEAWGGGQVVRECRLLSPRGEEAERASLGIRRSIFSGEGDIIKWRITLSLVRRVRGKEGCDWREKGGGRNWTAGNEG